MPSQTDGQRSTSKQRFGPYLRELRKAAGLTQRQLADKAKVDFTYLSKLENEILPPPSEEKIVVLARVLGHNSDDLLELARKVPNNLQERVATMPPEAAALLYRIARGNVTREQFKQMLKLAESGKRGRSVQARAVPPGRGPRGQ